MNNYRTTAAAAPLATDFDSQLRRALDRYVHLGRKGIDRKDAEATIRHFHMSDDVFDLGCELHRKGFPIDPRLWVYWMTNARVLKLRDKVVVYQQSGFFCRQLDHHFGKALKAHFGMPVIVDPENWTAG